MTQHRTTTRTRGSTDGGANGAVARVALAALIASTASFGCSRSGREANLERRHVAASARETVGREIADEPTASGAGARVRRSPALYQTNMADDVAYPPPAPRSPPRNVAGARQNGKCDTQELAERDRMRLAPVLASCRAARTERYAKVEVTVTVQAHIDPDGLVDALEVENGGAHGAELAGCIEEQVRQLRFDAGCPRIVVAPMRVP